MDVKCLKEICVLAVLKHGISKTRLPDTVAKEVERMERRVNSLFTGIFFYPVGGVDNAMSTIKIAWENGEWQLTPLNRETLRIRAGVENRLGMEGGDVFCFPGRRVSILDYRIDLDGMYVSFYGTCSTVKQCSEREFKVMLMNFASIDNSMVIWSQAYIVEEDGRSKIHGRLVSFSAWTIQDPLPCWSDGDDDSSVDYEIEDSVELDPAFLDCGNKDSVQLDSASVEDVDKDSLHLEDPAEVNDKKKREQVDVDELNEFTVQLDHGIVEDDNRDSVHLDPVDVDDEKSVPLG